MRIYTTLDTELQNYADSVLNKHLTEFENKNDYEYKFNDFPADTTDIVTPYVQGGVFSIEPSTGYVRILIGGRNFNHSKFNRMTQAKRQPGSAFKPILYTTALVNGYTAKKPKDKKGEKASGAPKEQKKMSKEEKIKQQELKRLLKKWNKKGHLP